MEHVKVSIELTVAQWNVVMQGVGNLPFAQVSEIVPLMRMQAERQLSAMQEPQMASEIQPS